MRNFRIDDSEARSIGAGGEMAKIRQNLDAIELLKNIEAEGRNATWDERAQLARYVDFGGLRRMWDQPWDFSEEHERLASLLTDEEIAAIKETALNTHYTSLVVVDNMWAAIRNLGFSGGRVLEPGMGIGNFFGRIPEDTSERSMLMGVEKNVISGRMAQMLYPDAHIAVRPYEEVQVPNNSVDLIIGNPPFGDIKIFDPAYNHPKLAVHNYFIVKSLDKLKPGGIAAVVTSHYTLDAVGSEAREEMSKRADMVGAIRLPDDAFKKNAGTEVTTDILFFQKRIAGESAKEAGWIRTAPMAIGDSGECAPVNEYFHAHPEMVLGAHSLEGSMYGAEQYTVTLTGDLGSQLQAAIGRLPANIAYQYIRKDRKEHSGASFTDAGDLAPTKVKEGAFFVEDGRVWRKEGGAKVPLPAELNKPGTIVHLKDAIALRDALKETIRIQMESGDDAALSVAQTTLRELYSAYRVRYGPLNAPKTARIFEDDPEYPLLTALENIDPETKDVIQADIFTKRTARPYHPLHELPTDPKAAMLKVLAAKGSLDTRLMAELLKQPEERVVRSLSDADFIFRDPVSGGQVTADAYLSGNVRVKLREARAAADLDPEFERNVDALAKVQPEPVPIIDIDARLGQTWIPRELYVKFLHEHLAKRHQGERPTVSRDNEGRWYVNLPQMYGGFELRHQWAGGGIRGEKLVEYALNQQQPTVYFPPDAEGRTELDAVNTAAARAKLQEIKEEFSRWIKGDEVSEFHPELEANYNEAFNAVRLRDYSGGHLDFPGLNPSFTPRDYQASTVWRIVQEGRALVAHDVGLGKTLTCMAAGMELRRIGLSRKNLYVVPNNMVPQWREDFKRAYPGANVLAVTDKDLSSAHNRQRLFSRIATNEWDAVIVPHSQFNMLPISPEREMLTIRRQMEELEETLQEHKGSTDSHDRSGKRTLRQLENAKQKFQQRLKELSAGRQDNTVYFDDLGVDMLFIDEAHAYKALPFATKMGNIAGLSTRRSQRAERVLAKVEYMFDSHNGRGVVFSTGTPITNTLGEQYLMTRYLAPDLLEGAGVRTFDDWGGEISPRRLHAWGICDRWRYHPAKDCAGAIRQRA